MDRWEVSYRRRTWIGVLVGVLACAIGAALLLAAKVGDSHNHIELLAAIESIAVMGLCIGGTSAAYVEFVGKGSVELDGDSLVLRRSMRTTTFSLKNSSFLYGKWMSIGGGTRGALLYFQSGEQQLRIGGTDVLFEHPESYRAAPSAEFDVSLTHIGFAELQGVLAERIAHRRDESEVRKGYREPGRAANALQTDANQATTPWLEVELEPTYSNSGRIVKAYLMFPFFAVVALSLYGFGVCAWFGKFEYAVPTGLVAVVAAIAMVAVYRRLYRKVRTQIILKDGWVLVQHIGGKQIAAAPRHTITVEPVTCELSGRGITSTGLALILGFPAGKSVAIGILGQLPPWTRRVRHLDYSAVGYSVGRAEWTPLVRALHVS